MLQSTSIFGVFEKTTVNTSVATTLLRLQASTSIPDIKDTLICISGCGPPSVDWGDDWGGDASSVMAKKADVEIVAFLRPSSTKTLEIMWKTQTLTNDHPQWCCGRDWEDTEDTKKSEAAMDICCIPSKVSRVAQISHGSLWIPLTAWPPFSPVIMSLEDWDNVCICWRTRFLVD